MYFSPFVSEEVLATLLLEVEGSFPPQAFSTERELLFTALWFLAKVVPSGPF